MTNPMIGPICRDLDRAIAELRQNDPNDPRIDSLENLKDQYGCGEHVTIDDLTPPSDEDINNYMSLRNSVDDLISARKEAEAASVAAITVVENANKFKET